MKSQSGHKRLSRGIKKYIRRRKAILREQFSGEILEQKIAELSQKFIQK